MTSLGYALSSEEHAPRDLVEHAALAEQHGFSFALISDHFHPWIDRQGQSPFVWGVLGAIAQRDGSHRHRHRASPARRSGSTRRSSPRPPRPPRP